MAATNGKLVRFVIILVLVVTAAISAATARPISCTKGGTDQQPRGTMANLPSVYPYTKATSETATRVGGAVVLGEKYRPLLFVSLPKGAYVTPSTPRNIGHSVKN